MCNQHGSLCLSRVKMGNVCADCFFWKNLFILFFNISRVLSNILYQTFFVFRFFSPLVVLFRIFFCQFSITRFSTAKKRRRAVVVWKKTVFSFAQQKTQKQLFENVTESRFKQLMSSRDAPRTCAQRDKTCVSLCFLHFRKQSFLQKVEFAELCE